MKNLISPERTLIVGGTDHRRLIREALPEIPARNIVLEPEGTIQIEGQAELHFPQGRVVEAGRPSQGDSLLKLQQLVGATIAGAKAQPPSSVSLRFSSGHFLLLFDSEASFESFVIDPGAIVV